MRKFFESRAKTQVEEVCWFQIPITINNTKILTLYRVSDLAEDSGLIQLKVSVWKDRNAIEYAKQADNRILHIGYAQEILDNAANDLKEKGCAVLCSSPERTDDNTYAMVSAVQLTISTSLLVSLVPPILQVGVKNTDPLPHFFSALHSSVMQELNNRKNANQPSCQSAR